MKFSVCVGSVRPAALHAAIQSIRRQTWTDWELIVVGQGTDPALRAVGTAAMAEDARVRYIHIERRGVSLARNVAVHAATSDIIAITDDDCEAREDWLATLADCLDAEPDVDVVGGALVAPKIRGRGVAKCPELIPAEALYDPVASQRNAPRGWDWATANVVFRRKALEQAGPFDECFGPGAVFRVATDTDYKMRLEACGVRMRSTPRAVVFHTHGCRRGVGAVLQRTIDYSYGHGALAGKLTLLEDARGREWLDAKRREVTLGWPPRPDRIGLAALQLWYFTRGYERCVREYRVDPTRGVLAPPAGEPAAARPLSRDLS